MDIWYDITEPVKGPPGFRSSFGGLWTDLSNAEWLIEGKLELGVIEEEDAVRLRHWIEHGYVVLEDCAAPEVVDALLADLDEVWAGVDPRIHIEHYVDGRQATAPIDPAFRSFPHKILDLHGYREACRRVAFAAPLARFLKLLFERPPMAFQSLYFETGTLQDGHQDTAFVPVSSPLEFVGTWVALEDVEPNSGELFYYPGSHRMPEYLWRGRYKSRPYDEHDYAGFYRWMELAPRLLGCEKVLFRPRRGTAVVWHADLVHGGSKNLRPGSTRRSIVTHFCPKEIVPEWFREGNGHSGRIAHESGCYYCYPTRGS